MRCFYAVGSRGGSAGAWGVPGNAEIKLVGGSVAVLITVVAAGGGRNFTYTQRETHAKKKRGRCFFPDDFGSRRTPSFPKKKIPKKDTPLYRTRCVSELCSKKKMFPSSKATVEGFLFVGLSKTRATTERCDHFLLGAPQLWELKTLFKENGFGRGKQS